MTLRKHILIGSVSTLALVGMTAPAWAADDSAAPTIVVTGIKQSLQRAISVKRRSDNQVDAISATDIGKLPDKNVADTLTRLPGVNVSSTASGEGGFDEADRVSIRGTSPSLTEVTIDGHNVSTGDWFILDQFQTVGRSVSFDLLPAEIVQGVTVYKTQDASQIEGGVAGSVDVETRSPLDLAQHYTVEAQAEAAYNSNSGNTKPQFNGLLGWKSADDTFGILVQGFYEERDSRRYGQETLGYTPISAGMPLATAHPELIGVEAPTLIGSSLFEQDRKREGVDGAIEWRPTDKIELKLTGFYSTMDATNNNWNYMYWGSHELANNLPTSYTVSNNTLTSAVWPGSYNGTPVDGLVVDSITRPHASADSFYYNLDGKYEVTDNLTIKGQIGYTQGTGNTPQEPAFEVDGDTAGISYAPSGNGWSVQTPFNTQSPNGLNNDWAWNEVFQELDKETYGKVDGDWKFGDGVVKDLLFGARVADHTRNVEGWDRGCTLGVTSTGADDCYGATPLGYSAINPTPYPGGYTASDLGVPGLLIPLMGNPSSVDQIVNAVPNTQRGAVPHIVQPINYYWMGSFKVHEIDTEGYVEGKFGGDKWHGNLGLRISDTQENSFVNATSPTADSTYVTSSAYGNYYIDHISHDYLDILPSLNFTYDLTKDVLLRFSAAETMSRPDFSALGGTVSLTDLTLTGSGGNANLKPIKGEVYDAAAEWYYGPSALAAVSVFHDDLSSYVSYGTTSETFVDQLLTGQGGTPVYSTYRISSPVNTTAELSGVELQIQQPLAYGFGVQTNATYVSSSAGDNQPMVGTSKWTYNAVGYFENKTLSVRLAYNYRSKYYVGVDRATPETQEGYGALDATVDVNLTSKVSLTFDALNITDSLLKYYAANPTQPRAVYDNGSQFFFGVRAKF